MSYLIRLSTTVKGLHQYVYLDKHCQDDLRMWYRFLCDWNGVSLFYDNALTCSADMELYTDASLVGFGAIFRQQWFSSAWPKEIPSVEDGHLSMAFHELIL